MFDVQRFLVDRLSVRVTKSVEELAQDAANIAIDYLQSLLNQQETVRIILATGNSQLQFLEHLVSSDLLDWSRVVLFHLDEYLGISPKHLGSFRYYLHHKVEKRINPRAFYYIQGDALQPLAECARYSTLLRQEAIDLCMLGIGENGHLAFNEPSVADFKDPNTIKIVRLEAKTRQQQVDGGYFSHLEAVPSYAYTLTIPTISAAKKIICLAGGRKKAEVIEKTLHNAIAPEFPATILRQLPQAILCCDRPLR
ncbi:MAG: glucosamine-6-phosphate deaminase [Pleurocapsa sp.]